MKRRWQIVTACIVLAGFVGCSSEDRGVTMHTPGAYKGDTDELLAKSQQQQQTLTDRFKLVQADR